MRITVFLIAVFASLFLITYTNSQPDFNGTSPGCGGSGCHTSEAGIVSAEVLNNFQVRITVAGTTSNVAGELVDASGNVVAVNNKTSSNPFILTAPSAGTYTVNAGFKSPSRKWGTTSAVINVTGVDEELVGLRPETFALYSNYPNPFNPTTKIRYAISQTAFTSLKVYSILGQEVATLINEEKTPGVYEVNFSGLNLTSGTYIYKLQSGDFTVTRKMLLLK
ncbi:MAG: T9SS type A sorting domain-containing protein [Ignavibacteria bacterium]|nr:T9SS type A sorting domain-containing protein [Ignavibacteria bacterium]